MTDAQGPAGTRRGLSVSTVIALIGLVPAVASVVAAFAERYLTAAALTGAATLCMAATAASDYVTARRRARSPQVPGAARRLL